MVEFGKRLKELRKQRNLTQKQLAQMIGVRNSIISFYEVGDRMPSLDIIIRLCHVLRVSSDYLLGLEQDRSLDISGLSETDKGIVRALVISLREKDR